MLYLICKIKEAERHFLNSNCSSEMVFSEFKKSSTHLDMIYSSLFCRVVSLQNGKSFWVSSYQHCMISEITSRETNIIQAVFLVNLLIFRHSSTNFLIKENCFYFKLLYFVLLCLGFLFLSYGLFLVMVYHILHSTSLFFYKKYSRLLLFYFTILIDVCVE